MSLLREANNASATYVVECAFVWEELSSVVVYANTLIASQSFAVISCLGAIQEPPTQKTLDSWSHCTALCCVMPPVGQKWISEKGDVKA
ncbi:hypothetical protein HNQ74_001254 [Bartonella doshiae]|nr:hypothetical protein [Bartonella doshiae]